MTNPLESGRAGLRVGFVPGVTLTKWRTIWKERFPRETLRLVEVPVADQARVLDAGEVDMCFVRLPLSTEGLHVIRLYDEAPVVWMSKDHLLTALDELSSADLADYQVLEEADPSSIDLVVLEEAVLRVPMSIARSHSRRDLVYRPVTDAATTTVALAWRADNPHESIDDFIGIVRGRTENSSRTAQARTAADQTHQKAAQGSGRGPKQGGAPKPARPARRGKSQRRH